MPSTAHVSFHSVLTSPISRHYAYFHLTDQGPGAGPSVSLPRRGPGPARGDGGRLHFAAVAPTVHLMPALLGSRTLSRNTVAGAEAGDSLGKEALPAGRRASLAGGEP